MHLKREAQSLARAEAIDEGLPLPPEDRVRFARHDWLDRLYRGQRGKLVRFARRHAAADRAADIVQQLFARLAARPLDVPLSLETPDAYLRQATMNLIRDEGRREARCGAQLHVCLEDVQVAGGDPVAALEARDIIGRLEHIVSRLSPRTREIFLAHRIDGFSYAEIAVRTGLSVKTVEKHMTRAIAYVTRHLDV